MVEMGGYLNLVFHIRRNDDEPLNTDKATLWGGRLVDESGAGGERKSPGNESDQIE